MLDLTLRYGIKYQTRGHSEVIFIKIGVRKTLQHKFGE